MPGYLLNQWSLSEHEGTLRAATTSMPPWDSDAKSESAVRTLQERDGRLVQVGRVGGLGHGERIYAVRYIGDTGFVVTFRQVDPLYTLDLSDPEAPRVAGELKVPGYSAYLHPLGDGLLLGVGQDATEEGRRTGRAAVAVRRLEPGQAGAGSTSTPSAGTRGRRSRSDHHAFLWWAPERLAVIPAVRYDEDYEQTAFAGSLAFRVTRAGGIAEVAQLAHPRFERFGDLGYERSVVVGGRLLLRVLGGRAVDVRRRAGAAAVPALRRLTASSAARAALQPPCPASESSHWRWPRPAPPSRSPRPRRWPSWADPTPPQASSRRSPR